MNLGVFRGRLGGGYVFLLNSLENLVYFTKIELVKTDSDKLQSLSGFSALYAQPNQTAQSSITKNFLFGEHSFLPLWSRKNTQV